MQRSSEKSNYQILYEIGLIILAETDLDSMLKKAMDHVIAVTRSQRGFIALVRDGGGEFDFMVARNLRKVDIEEPGFEVSRSIIKHVISRGQQVCLDNAMEDPRFSSKRSVMDLQLLSVLCTPIVFDEQVVGMIYVDNSSDERVFTDEVAQLLDLFSRQMAIALNNAFAFSLERQKSKQLAEELRAKYRFEEIVTRDARMTALLEKVAHVAETDATVLILGENGTGKELIAKALHKNSPRSESPFITVNCGAIPETLMESHLFGHAKGAFTGAEKTRRGKFELADGGTIFLDEIGDLSPGTQVKLLRVLQDGSFTPLGVEEARGSDVRVIAATNRNLREMVEKGEFREDLFYRLNVVPLNVPPLRERRVDVIPLAEHFIRKHAKSADLPVLSKPVQRFLMEYDYGGNVRELDNIIEHATIFCKGKQIEPEHLQEDLQYDIIKDEGEIIYRELKQRAIEKWERNFFTWLLTKSGGRLREAARIANMDVSALSEGLKRNNMRLEDFRQ